MKIIVELKKKKADTYVFCIIISKFRHWQEFCAIILLVIDKNLEISFYCIILFFSLTVNIEIKGGGEFFLNVYKVI